MTSEERRLVTAYRGIASGRARLALLAIAESMSLPVVLSRDGLYDAARQACHEAGLPWTDPRDGRTHRPPRRKRVRYPGIVDD